MSKLNDALDVKVVAHINGLPEVQVAIRDLDAALTIAKKALSALSVELEVE
ncbi:hypothetical protein SEA_PHILLYPHILLY_14 [Microbacterium phage PhillyPhilly]|nr:hypothetical protein SEA_PHILLYPHILLY_14 [Microbacterium phage PhillyPhilly]